MLQSYRFLLTVSALLLLRVYRYFIVEETNNYIINKNACCYIQNHVHSVNECPQITNRNFLVHIVAYSGACLHAYF